jgi:hypothetical protein
MESGSDHTQHDRHRAIADGSNAQDEADFHGVPQIIRLSVLEQR